MTTYKSSGQDRSGLALLCLLYATDALAESGDLLKSLEAGEKALEVSRELNGEEHPTTAASYGKLGELNVASGDYERGIELLLHSLALAVKVHGENHSGTAWIYRGLSAAFERQNDLGKAIEYARRALEIQRQTLGDNHPDVAYSLENLARIEERRGQYQKAHTHFNEAIEIRERSEKGAPRNDIARLYAKLGELYTRIKQNRLALAALEKSRDIQNRLSEHNARLKGATERAFGDLYAQQGALDPALRSYRQSIAALSPGFADTSISSNPLGQESLDPNGLLEALVGKANVLDRRFASASRDVRDLAASLSALECASEVADRLRKTFVTEGSKLLLEDRINSIYEDGLRRSLRLYEATGNPAYKLTAFSFAEESKANVLLDGIRDAEAKRFAGIPDSLLDRERQMRADITFCEARLERESENTLQQQGTGRSNLEKKLFALKEAFRELLSDMERDYPAFYTMRFRSHAVTVAEIQATLDNESCLVEYLVGAHTLYIFTISKHGYEVTTRPKPLRLDDLARKFAASIRTVDAAEYLRAGPALYDIILRPVVRELVGKHRLIVVPDGLLYYVPFEALLSGRAPGKAGENKQADFTSLPYLVRSYEVSYSFSSSFYLDALQRGIGERHARGGFAGFAPVFRDSVKNGYLVASRGPTAEVTLAGLRSITVDGKRFNELPFSEDEVQSIVRDFQKNGTRSAGYFNRDASEDNFKQNVGKYTYVHIATHGIMNEDHPALSSLLFSQPGDSTLGEDGFLYAGEAYGLKLDADLLVLSSCESGVGKLVRGEGLMAMTRGFFYAGARNIVFSLWKVYDDATNRLMLGFYDSVIKGSSYASALRDAKLKMIANPSTAFPCKWGAFVLMGR